MRPSPSPLSPAANERTGWLFAVAAVAVACGIWALEPRIPFQTDDDSVMAMIAGGFGLVDAPDPHLVFTNAALGRALAAAAAAGAVNPYGTHLLATAAVGIGIWGLALGRLTGTSLARRGLASAVLAICGAVVVLWPQFTLVAGALAGGAAALGASLLAAPPDGRVGIWGYWVLTAAAAAYAALVREASVAGIVLAAAIPLALLVKRRWCADDRRAGRVTVRAAFIAASAALVSAAGAHAADARAYRAPEWAAFRQLDALRVPFTDYAYTDPGGGSPALQEVGWTKNDLRLMRSWYLLHAGEFTEAQASYVLARVAVWRGVPHALGTMRSALVPSLLQPRVAVVLFGSGLLALLLAQYGDRSGAVAVAASLALLVLAFWALAIAGRAFFLRIYFPPLAALLAAATVLLLSGRFGRSAGAVTPRVGRGAARALAVGGIGLATTGVVLIPRLATRAREASRELDAATLQARALMLARPGHLLVIAGGTFPLRALVRPRYVDPVLRRTPVLVLNTATFTPFTWRRLAQAGVRDLNVALLTDPRVHLVAPSTTASLMVTMYAEHLGRTVRACPSVRAGALTAYQFRAECATSEGARASASRGQSDRTQ